MRFQSRRCLRCSLRFPVDASTELGAVCPACGAVTERVDAPYATQPVERAPYPAPRLRLEALLDNVRSVRNVGSMFRTADGVGIDHLFLGGFTPTPAHPRIAKTALGAERSVPWSHHPDAAVAANALVDAGHRLWALEGGSKSTSLFEVGSDAVRESDRPLVLVLGHEVSGVDPAILAVSERLVHLPMAGIKGSLNVSVAFGVASYLLTRAAAQP